MRKALFPGSFDPITKGHYDIVIRASKMFDEIVVALGANSSKQRFFPVDKCIKMIEDTFSSYQNIKVIHYDILTVELCKKLDIRYIVRGIRNVGDFEFERSLAEMNKKLLPDLETVFLDSNPVNIPISSTIVRELIRNKADVSAFVPDAVLKYL